MVRKYSWTGTVLKVQSVFGEVKYEKKIDSSINVTWFTKRNATNTNIRVQTDETKCNVAQTDYVVNWNVVLRDIAFKKKTDFLLTSVRLGRNTDFHLLRSLICATTVGQWGADCFQYCSDCSFAEGNPTSNTDHKQLFEVYVNAGIHRIRSSVNNRSVAPLGRGNRPQLCVCIPRTSC
jgi:hypothetical protein